MKPAKTRGEEGRGIEEDSHASIEEQQNRLKVCKRKKEKKESIVVNATGGLASDRFDLHPSGS